MLYCNNKLKSSKTLPNYYQMCLKHNKRIIKENQEKIVEFLKKVEQHKDYETTTKLLNILTPPLCRIEGFSEVSCKWGRIEGFSEVSCKWEKHCKWENVGLKTIKISTFLLFIAIYFYNYYYNYNSSSFSSTASSTRVLSSNFT